MFCRTKTYYINYWDEMGKKPIKIIRDAQFMPREGDKIILTDDKYKKVYYEVKNVRYNETFSGCYAYIRETKTT